MLSPKRVELHHIVAVALLKRNERMQKNFVSFKDLLIYAEKVQTDLRREYDLGAYQIKQSDFETLFNGEYGKFFVQKKYGVSLNKKYTSDDLIKYVLMDASFETLNVLFKKENLEPILKKFNMDISTR